MLVSIFLFLEARDFPLEFGFSALLLSLHEMNLYLIPLLCLFIASFAVMQEKELKTLMMIMTKKESYRSFLMKKSIAIHVIIGGIFVAWYFLMAIPMKLFFAFTISDFMSFIITTLIFVVIFNQIGLMLGSICSTRMQLIGANIFTWFLFVFIFDLLFLNLLPSVSYENVRLFSYFYFSDPLHALTFYLETSLSAFPLENLSRMMKKLVWMAPWKFVLWNLLLWVVVCFECSIWLRSRGERE